jgi:hypothetical protein
MGRYQTTKKRREGNEGGYEIVEERREEEEGVVEKGRNPFSKISVYWGQKRDRRLVGPLLI